MKSKGLFAKSAVRDFLVMLVLAFLLFLISIVSQAQVVPYSQYDNTPLLTNPSQAAQGDDTQLAVHYRRSRVADYEIPSVSFVYPFYHRRNGLRAGGLGAHLIRQQAGPGGAYAVTSAMATFAYTIHLSTNHHVSAGLQGGITNKKLDLSRITTDNQFSFGAFDPALAHGENFRSASITKPVFNSGFSYTVTDTSNVPNAEIGIAFFNLNRPSYEFIGDARREELAYLATGEVLLWKSGRTSLHPTVRYMRGATSFANIGTQVRYELPLANSIVGAGVWYKTTQAIVGALQYSNAHYRVAASMDLSVASNLAANINNAFEISFGWRFRRKAKYRPAPSAVREASPQEEPAKQPLQPTLEPQQHEAQREIEPDKREEAHLSSPVTENKAELREGTPASIPASADELTLEEKAVLHTRIEFKLGSSELTAASVEFIKTQLVAVLKKHPQRILHITGHCCTLGDKAVNEKISLHRAEAIAKILIQQGISEKNLVLTGMDFQKPVAGNNTEAGRQKNRRAEFELRK